VKTWKLITLAILLVLSLIVIIQNTAIVETRILFITFQMPRALLLFITLFIGFILGVLVALWNRRDKKK